MEQTAASLLSTLKRPAINSDSKIATLNSLKSDIKHFRVPEAALSNVFECLRLAITQQASSQLVHSALSTLAHLIKRLSIQDASGSTITQLAPRLLPALQDRLGDLREAIRTSTGQALNELFPYLASDVEHIVRDEAIGGSNARAKEAGMAWVVRMHKEESMPFKGYVGPIVATLEDSDGNVREAAKNALVALFGDASERAKADLKKQLKAHQVRLSIEAQILTQLGLSGRPASAKEKDHDNEAMTGSTRSLPVVDHVAQFADSINSEAAQPPPQETVPMDPIYVHTERELNETFADMLPHFEGKETEQNWLLRDKSVLKIRRLLKGNAANEFHNAFMAGIKSSVDGILKVANSLRTTMSSNGCQLVQELARTLGPALDPHTEMFLQSFVKMTAATKHIASENGRHTADAIFQHCSYSARLMQHIWHAAQDKNASTRQCAPEWLRTILRRQTGYKAHFESSGGLDLTEKSIKKGLDDANPKVKEGTRHTFWVFAKAWPDRADAIMNKLDLKSKALLEKDSNNPNAGLHAPATTASTAKPTVAARSTLKEMLAEQRRAKSAAKGLPERPGSAMAALSPQKTRTEMSAPTGRGPSKLRSESRAVSGTSTTSTAASAGTASTTTKGSSLMSGPVRRPRRPEIQRPQTADPYASRRLVRPETPANGTPANGTPKGTGASKISVASGSTSASRNRARTAGQGGPSREGSPNIRRSPVHTAKRFQESSRPTSKDSNATRTEDFSSLPEDDLTMVMPTAKPAINKRTAALAHPRPGLDHTASVDSGLASINGADGDTDGFTMVIPQLSASYRERSPLDYRSPMKAMFESARDLADRPSSSSSSQHKRQQSDPFLEQQNQNSLSPHRRQGSRSPTKSASPQPPEVQIYEDPPATIPASPGFNASRPVLSELPVNENLRSQSPVRSTALLSNSPRRTSEESLRQPSSQDKSEIMRNRRLLASGIERIKARSLDAHGFRRVQELARTSSPEIWEQGERYGELVSALLSYLRGFESDAHTAGKGAVLRGQALAVLRVVLSSQRKHAQGWCGSALVGVLESRKSAEQAGQAGGADFERTGRDIVALVTSGARSATVQGVVEWLFKSADEEAAPKVTTMALGSLRALAVSAQTHGAPLSADLQGSLAKVAAKFVGDSDAEVRKAGVELACEVFAGYGAEGKEGFWSEFKGVEEGRLGLLTYYIAKKERAIAAA